MVHLKFSTPQIAEIFRVSAGSIWDQMSEQIVTYLKANGYTRVSFQRLGTLMGFSEETLRSLIQNRPDRFRFSLLKGNKSGIALTGDS
jgi:hypothetical protein